MVARDALGELEAVAPVRHSASTAIALRAGCVFSSLLHRRSHVDLRASTSAARRGGQAPVLPVTSVMPANIRDQARFPFADEVVATANVCSTR